MKTTYNHQHSDGTKQNWRVKTHPLSHKNNLERV